jgi:hypothetical protein
MIALLLELAIASGSAYAVWTGGHPVMAVIVWFTIMGVSNTALSAK